MIISLIVAMDENGCIGMGGRLPWHLRRDLFRFKEITMGHHLVMGRKTFESIGRILPGRDMIVITRRRDYHFPDVLVSHSLESALQLASQRGADEVFIIGGGEIFTLALPIANRIYLTRVHARVECDTHFPEFDPASWEELERQEFPADEDNQYPTTFSLLSRPVKFDHPSPDNHQHVTSKPS